MSDIYMSSKRLLYIVCRRFRAPFRRQGHRVGVPFASSVLSLVTLPTALAVILGTLGIWQAEAQPAPVVLNWRTVSDDALLSVQAQRAVRIAEHAERYRLNRRLAEMIYDAALRESLDPALAFGLVMVESSFRRFAVGPAGSVGYTQVRPSTAEWLDPSVTRDRLFETETNLRIGFRYLRMLLDRFDEDTRLALLAYNRGPNRVGALLAVGRDPANGYAHRVLRSAGTEPASVSFARIGA
jgi:hypothetical protein